MASPSHDAEQIRDTVRAKYGAAAQAVLNRDASAGAPAAQFGCCGTSGCGCGPTTQVSADYRVAELELLPADAISASLGCGNPTALADLAPGETVLDLGSGGGIDVLLSARRVGPTGYVYGLDMTDEMLALAERNRAESGLSNVEFRKGQIEAIPLPSDSVDVVISNCVINLSTDKPAALREAFRVLRPGGRFAVNDIVVQGELPASLRSDLEAWAGCVSGALEQAEYLSLLAEAGFEQPSVEVVQAYDPTDVLGCCAPTSSEAGSPSGRIVSAFIRARKPSRTA